MFLSKYCKVLGVATLCFLVFNMVSCTNNDPDNPTVLIPTGTYNVKVISEGDNELEDASGTVSVKDSGSDGFKLGIKSLTYKGISLSSPVTAEIKGSVKKIDDKAYEVSFDKTDVIDEKNYKFKFKYALEPAVKLALGLSFDEVVFESDKEAAFKLTLDHPTKKITYEGKEYVGLITKDEFKLGMKISVYLKIDLTQAELIAAIKDDSVKAAVQAILTGSDTTKKTAVTTMLTTELAAFKAGKTLAKELVLTLKK